MSVSETPLERVRANVAALEMPNRPDYNTAVRDALKVMDAETNNRWSLDDAIRRFDDWFLPSSPR